MGALQSLVLGVALDQNSFASRLSLTPQGLKCKPVSWFCDFFPFGETLNGIKRTIDSHEFRHARASLPVCHTANVTQRIDSGARPSYCS
jgi:hypothetical protein